MNVLRIGASILIPFLLLFLAFATWMGYIAENIRDYYHFKWAALLLLAAGYILQFYKITVGYILVVVSIIAWFLL
ncbi:hypothetical protein CN378_04625 [Bacillus sp. AFS015802]|uniref:hypothetical protein n=1 Tax=Bacillus sp. AFS015802 TaxID=2033486 RepID=UPI000BF661A1|nr:hypothetical protein [Bacillus sp. AFS015802]PFA69166.1 hypothetical protein CN378_04625 [Bacillus sp. AFS015802]